MAGVLLVIPQLYVPMIDMVTMTMELQVLDGLHSSLECLKQMGKLDRRMTESACTERWAVSQSFATAQVSGLPPNPGCRLGLESKEGFRVKG